ncbi:hypothetical protein JYQ62_27290 [Nostoc sp. UHCC 0702]|nr:hypothetical protein JYQ62_27290 [Nostoc sp. UHCC 0702]
MITSLLGKKLEPIKNRDPKYLEADKSAVRAIAQAAINVELFTMPLYMVALYSIQGTHPINTKGIDYYKGRVWPGSATTATPTTANEQAFNIVFSVFIDEMLHLQMVANLAKVIDVQPSLTSDFLQDECHGWTCYGDDKTVIPHIVNLQDTKNNSNVKVKLDSLNREQNKLFLAIEQCEADARENILPEKVKDYFPTVPFANWTADKREIDLPMFGTIGWLYECYACYLDIEYSDGKTLWKEIYSPNALKYQKDMFNYTNDGHPEKEFPGFEPKIQLDHNQEKQNKTNAAFNQVIDMMSAITDQGEGSTIEFLQNTLKNAQENTIAFAPLENVQENTISLARWKKNPTALTPLLAFNALVEDKYRPSEESLKKDYPAYTDTGKPACSRDAKARYEKSELSHYDRFKEMQEKLLSDVVTWDIWHKTQNIWTAKMLITEDYKPDEAPKNIPTPEEVAGALNRLKQNDIDGNNYKLISQAAVGAIAGITTVLDNYWQNPDLGFPYPSMVGSGDRVSISWAIFGKAPDLSLGIGLPEDTNKLYHACQGLDIENPDDTSEAPVQVFHTCRGSNKCKAQGGCGFAQLDSGGGSCRHMPVAKPTIPKEENLYSSPSHNKCKSFGGCAIPISASQLFPKEGMMRIYNFVGPRHEPNCINKMSFKLGDNVYDKAWEAYTQVMAARGQKPGEKPKPSDLRLAFPPST